MIPTRNYDHGKALTFWKWEYTRRNDSYTMQDKQLRELEYTNKDICHDGPYFNLGDFGINIGQDKRRQCYETSVEILFAVQNNSLEYKYPLYSKVYPSSALPANEAFCTKFYNDKLKDLQKWMTEKNRMLFVIDFSKPIESIFNDIAHFYYLSRMENFFEKNTDGCPYSGDNGEELKQYAKGYLDSMSKRSVMNEIMSNKKPNDIPRAIGLWMWDYIKENKVSQTKAIKELQRCFDLQKLGKAESSERNFSFYYSRTKKCIEQCAVLPFDPKARNK